METFGRHRHPKFDTWTVSNGIALAVPQVAAPLLTGPLVDALDARRHGVGPRVALICVIVEFAIGTVWLWRLRLSSARAVERST